MRCRAPEATAPAVPDHDGSHDVDRLRNLGSARGSRDCGRDRGHGGDVPIRFRRIGRGARRRARDPRDRPARTVADRRARRRGRARRRFGVRPFRGRRCDALPRRTGPGFPDRGRSRAHRPRGMHLRPARGGNRARRAPTPGTARPSPRRAQTTGEPPTTAPTARSRGAASARVRVRPSANGVAGRARLPAASALRR